MAEREIRDIDILIVEPGQAPRPAVIQNTLVALEKTLGGTIQMGCFLAKRVYLVSREDTAGMVPNRRLPGGEGHVTGTFLLCGMLGDNDWFGSLTAEQQEEFQRLFREPGEFMMVGSTAYADPDNVADAVYNLWESMEDGAAVVLTKWGGQKRGADA